jgi:hypothetical protein
LRAGVEGAFERFRAAGARTCTLVFDVAWQPTMDVVDAVTEALGASKEVETLSLVHPSAAMSFIASAVSMRVRTVKVTARRSIYDDEDEAEELQTDATGAKTMFLMAPTEDLEAFVRRAISEARKRVSRRVALIFDRASKPPMDLADVLAEELLQTGVKEIGFIHESAPLDALAAALRLRLPGVTVAVASRSAAPRSP